MKRASVSILLILLLVASVIPQTTQTTQQRDNQEETIRITTSLVQTDVVVTDKNDQPVPDLKLGDFEVYENGKKQDVKFMEYVSVDTGRRSEGQRPASASTDVPGDISAGELKRVVAFVIDDLNIPFEDMVTVREMLKDFVDNKMQAGDLVAIVRVVGGKGLLQQFTSDKQLLRRAIATLNISTHPFAQFNNPGTGKLTRIPAPASAEGGDGASTSEIDLADFGPDLTSGSDDTQRLFRGLFSLSTADYVVESMKQIPGRKSLVLISGGIPIFETQSSGISYSNVSYLLNQLADHATRAGVVISTMDPRGLTAQRGVASYSATPAKSGLGGSLGEIDETGASTSGLGGGGTRQPGFGRGSPAEQAVFDAPLKAGEDHLGLSTAASATGGISVVNTNNFKAGLDRVLARSRGYYLLAYTPSEKFDNKFRKIQIKVKRADTKVYSHFGYIAREDAAATARTKEEAIAAVARSPLARRDVEVSANLSYTTVANNKAVLNIGMLIDAKKLHFTQSTDGKYQTSFDIAGFVYDQLGKLKGGFSETISSNLSPADYARALATGLIYSTNTEVQPGYYQFRGVVRETSTGNVGSLSRYFEIPDLANGRLAMSSILLYGVDAAKGASAQPEPLLALRQLSRKQELRYAAVVYNAKLISNRTQAVAQIIISQGDKTLFQEPEQPLTPSNTGQIVKLGQLGLANVKPGHYVLTVVVTDPLADKKWRIISRSIDFTVVD